MRLIVGAVDGNFDATAGLVFEAARKSVQYLSKTASKERRQKKSCHVSSLLPEIGVDGGLLLSLRG
jgi:DNA topoisomerase VI subunit B